MPLICPFPGLRPLPEKAAEVAAPPYDVLDSNEARERAKGKPWSFLHISKPEIDLAPGTDPYSPEVYAKGKENFIRMIEEGVLKQDSVPCYYLYRLIMGDHQQTGLVAAASVADYDTNRIRKHEFTRPDKEDDRVRQVDALSAQTGPVFLTYKHNAIIDELAAKATSAAPEIDIVADTGVRHSLWVRERRGAARSHHPHLRRHGLPLHRGRPSPLRRRLARGRGAQGRQSGPHGRRGLQLFPVGDLPR